MKRLLALVVLVFMLAGCGWPTDDGIIFRTADPNLSFLLLVAGPMPAEVEGEAMPEPEPPPPCEVVKGNISRSGERIYHVEGQLNYNRVKIDEAQGEQFFCSEAEAIEAGWRRALK